MGTTTLTSFLLMSTGDGGAAVLGAMQFANQKRWLAADEPACLTANLVGAGMVFASLPVEWNTATGLLVLVWAALSLFGLCRGLLVHTRR